MITIKKFTTAFFLSCLSIISFAQSYVEIGTGTETTSYPTYSVYNYGWYSMILPQSEIGAAKSITKIAVNCQNGPKTSNNQKIYLKTTSNSIFSSANYEDPTNNGYTLVFDGNITFNGWTIIDLSTAFAYNGTDNLIIHWENRSGNSSYANFYRTNSTINNNKGAGNDVSFPTASGYLNPYPSALPNVRLYYASTGPVTPSNPIPADNATKVDLNSTLQFTLGANTTLYDLYFSTDSAMVVNLNISTKVASDITVSAAGNYTYTPTNILTAGTKYFWKVVAKNATTTEASSLWKFNTQNTITNFPYNQGFEGTDVIYPGWYGFYTDWTYPTTGDAQIWSIVSETNAHTGVAAIAASPSTLVNTVSSSLKTPRIILPANHRVSFWWRNGANISKTTTKDTTYFEITTNGGNTWTTLETLSPVSAQATFVNVTKDLAAYAGNNVYLRWRYVKAATGSSNTYIDDIVIEETPNGSVIGIDPTSLSFNPICVGAHTKLKFYINNTGVANLNVTSIAVSAPFSCSYTGTIAAGATDSAEVIFNGTAIGNYTRTLTINSNASNGNLSIALAGEVIATTSNFVQTFDATATGSIPTGWIKIKSLDPYQSLNNVEVKNSSLDAHSAPNVARMYNNTDTISSLILIAPGTTNFDVNTLKFWATKTWGNVQQVNLLVGLMDDPYDAASFDTIQTIALNDTITEYIINFSSTNTKPYIAFKHGNLKKTQSIWIDDIDWQGVINTPPPPAAVVFPVNNAVDMERNITLKWTNTGGNPTGYKLYLGTNNPPTNMQNGIDLGDTTQFVINQVLNYATYYYWKIVPYNSFGDATNCPVWNFKVMNDPTITNLPWTEGFEGVTQATGFTYPLGWSIINNNDQFNSWDLIVNSSSNPTNAHAGNNAMHTSFTFMNPIDDWLVTPPIVLNANQDYTFSFWLKSPVYIQAPDTSFEKFEVAWGNLPTAAGMSNLVYLNEHLRMLEYTKITSTITPSQTGSYYFGFHTFSDALQWLVIIDDVSLDIVTSVNNLINTNNRCKVFPNPNNGDFNLMIQMNQSETATIQLFDISGKMVFNTVKELMQGKDMVNINSDNLPKGIYCLKIQTNSEIITDKVIIQ